jgi:hypothetical protein
MLAPLSTPADTITIVDTMDVSTFRLTVACQCLWTCNVIAAVQKERITDLEEADVMLPATVTSGTMAGLNVDAGGIYGFIPGSHITADPNFKVRATATTPQQCIRWQSSCQLPMSFRCIGGQQAHSLVAWSDAQSAVVVDANVQAAADTWQLCGVAHAGCA